MTRDVYAGDEDQLRGVRPDVHARVLFVVTADAQPDSLARIAAVVAMSNRPPVGGSVVEPSPGRLVVSIELRDCPVTTAGHLQRKLAQLTCVVATELRPVDAAATSAATVR